MIDDIQAKTENAKTNMQTAIDQAIENNDQIEDLSKMSKDLESNADLFQKRAVEVKKDARKQYCKAYICHIIIVLFLLFLIFLVFDHFFDVGAKLGIHGGN